MAEPQATVRMTIYDPQGNPASGCEVNLVKAVKDGVWHAYGPLKVKANRDGVATFYAPRHSYVYIRAMVVGLESPCYAEGVPFYVPNQSAVELIWSSTNPPIVDFPNTVPVAVFGGGGGGNGGGGDYLPLAGGQLTGPLLLAADPAAALEAATRQWVLAQVVGGGGGLGFENLIATSWYESLPAALTAIGVSNVTLLVDNRVDVPTPTVIGDNVGIVMGQGGMFVKSGTGSINFNGENFALDGCPPRPVFEGFAPGEILFTGARGRFRLEWFGGRANNGGWQAANSLAWEVFRRAVSQDTQLAPFSQQFGSAIEFLAGCYWFADSMHVTRQMDISGVGAAGRNRTTYLRFAPGKTGIILHSSTSSTNAGLAYPGEASWSHVHHLQLIGDPRGSDGTVSCTGMTVTKTSGADIWQNDSFHATIQIGDRSYTPQYASPPTATSVVLAPPQFFATGTAGNSYIQFSGASPGDGHWQAGTVITVDLPAGPKNLTVAYMESPWVPHLTAPLVDTFVNAYVRVTDIRFTNAPYRWNRHHGIDMYVQAKITEVAIQEFQGNGINANSDPYGANCNMCYYESCDVMHVAGHGIMNGGGNSQVNTINTCSVENVGGWGFRDEAAYSNLYECNHTSGNLSGCYWKVPAFFNQTTFTSCYMESGQVDPFAGYGGVSLGMGIAGGIGYWVTGLDLFVGSNTNIAMAENTIIRNAATGQEILRTISGSMHLAGSGQTIVCVGPINAPRIDIQENGNQYWHAGPSNQYHWLNQSDGFLRLRDELQSGSQRLVIAPNGSVGLQDPNPQNLLSIHNYGSLGTSDVGGAYQLIGSNSTPFVHLDANGRGVVFGKGWFFKQVAATPTAADLPAGQCQVFKNTTTGRISLWVNDGGTLKEIAGVA